MHHAPPQVLARPGGAQPIAFDAEKGKLVERIHHPEPRIEFEAIDDTDWIAEPDVFGPQVPVSVDDVSAAHPLRQKLAPLAKKTSLHGLDMAHLAGRKLKAWIK